MLMRMYMGNIMQSEQRFLISTNLCQLPTLQNRNLPVTSPTSESVRQVKPENGPLNKMKLILCKIYQKYHIKLKAQDTCCFLWRMAGIPKDSLPSSSSRQWWWRISSSIALTCSLRWKKFIIRYSIRGLGSSMLIIWIIGTVKE